MARIVVLSVTVSAFILSGILLLFHHGRGKSADAAASGSAPAGAMSPAVLDSAYTENPLAAESDYDGKVVTIHGKITDIDQGWIVDYYVMLAGGNGVQCNFSKKDRDRLAKLKRGQWVTIRGRVAGKLAGHVGLAGCEILD